MARPNLLFVILLFFFSPEVIRAQAQSKTLFDIRSTENERDILAKQWAADNSYPLLQYLADESLIGVQGFQDGAPVYFTTHNQRAGTYTRTISLHPGQSSGLELSGLNFEIGMWDASPAFDGHQEHHSRVIKKESGGVSNHATHVAGTLIASGVYTEALGMAPKARVHSYNWNFHSTEMLVEARDGLLISNHSYGRIAGWHKFRITADSSRWQWFGNPEISQDEDYIFGYYDQDASLFDHVTYTHPFFLPVVSAGNERDDFGVQSGIYLALDSDNRWVEYDASTRPIPPDGSPGGFDTLTGIATAKNVLTVGSIIQGDGLKALEVSAFSSSGPTDDGRVKPDIVGIGENLISTIASGSADYASYSGTSMATPNVSGSLILLQQLAKNILGNPLRAATIKGLVIHTASDLGPPGPDYLTGWGLLNTEKAAEHIRATLRDPIRIIEEQISDRKTQQFELLVQETQDIRITLSWTDPPFSPLKNLTQNLLDNSTPTLVHDLNLQLINQASGEVFLPYILSEESPELPATTGINSVDPIEQIYVPNANPGLYFLVVDAAANFTTETQDYTLLISGLEKPVSPIVLDTANIHVEMGNVVLNWRTMAENEPGFFIIERADASIMNLDGTKNNHFEQIASLNSQGLPEKSMVYQYSDEVYLEGDYHYRVLFIQEESSERTLLAEFEVNLPAPNNFAIASVFPNPINSQGTLILDMSETRYVELTIFNSLGQRMTIFPERKYEAGRHFIKINPATWPVGMYFAQISSQDLKLTRSFVVVN